MKSEISCLPCIGEPNQTAKHIQIPVSGKSVWRKRVHASEVQNKNKQEESPRRLTTYELNDEIKKEKTY